MAEQRVLTAILFWKLIRNSQTANLRQTGREVLTASLQHGGTKSSIYDPFFDRNDSPSARDVAEDAVNIKRLDGVNVSNGNLQTVALQ